MAYLLFMNICYQVHRELLEKYNLETDIVFSRPNYCKIDLMVNDERGDQLFMQEDEMSRVKNILSEHGINGGLKQMVSISEEMEERFGTKVSATCDAKYLEVGISCKSDNVNTILSKFESEGIKAEECSYWGDEYVGIEDGLFGSDSFMKTEKTKNGDFYDVSSLEGSRPENVEVLGGGVSTFVNFFNRTGKEVISQ